MTREISPPWGQDVEDAFTAHFDMVRRMPEEGARASDEQHFAVRLVAVCKLGAIAMFVRISACCGGLRFSTRSR